MWHESCLVEYRIGDYDNSDLYLAPWCLDVAIRTCDTGNSTVGSFGDNVPTGATVSSMWPCQDTYEKLWY